MIKLNSKVEFANENVKNAFERLKNGKGEEKKLYEWLVRAFKDIEENAFCGVQIPKRLIPEEYCNKFNIHNAWKYNLPNAWRLIYSLENKEIVVVSIVLEWMDHKSYERRFKF